MIPKFTCFTDLCVKQEGFKDQNTYADIKGKENTDILLILCK